MERNSTYKYPIVISSPNAIEKEVEQLLALFAQGLQLFHLRKPQWLYEDSVRFLEQVPQEYHKRIVLHQHYDLVNCYDLRGIHGRFTPEDVKGFSTKRISTSTHTIQEFNDLPMYYDYAFLSPIFPSISKSGYASTEDWQITLKQRTNYHTKLIALGGVHPDRVSSIHAMGFDGYALLGAIWSVPHGIKNFERCL